MVEGEKVNNEKQIKTFKYFNIMYAIALITIAVVIILSQILIQGHLNNQIDDSHVVNLAGRQRMLSQAITKNCLLISQGEWNQQIKQELTGSTNTWRKVHRGLKNGDISLDLSHHNSSQIREKLAEMDTFMNCIIRYTDAIIEEREKISYSQALIEGYTRYILENEYHFLLLMDQAVDLYDKEAQNKVFNLKRIEFWLLGIGLLTLLLEVFFIFKPTASRIKRVINEFVRSEKKATEGAAELNRINEELHKTFRQNRDFNFALDKATVLIRTDERGEILYANDKYCVITKYKQHELLGKQLFFNNKGQEESIIYKHIKNEKICATVWQGEILDQAKDGANFWLDVTMMPILNEKGTLYQYLVVCSDITPRKEAETQLQELNELKLKEQKDEQRLVSHAIITGQEKERKRMAVEIHDGIGQQLTALKFECEALEPHGDKQERDIVHIQNLLYDTIKEVRRISSNILPSALADFGLGPSIKELVGTLKKSSAIKVTFKDSLELPQRLNKHIEVSLYRIAQEAINNALKHSNANRIQISLNNNEEFLNLTVKDDGVGFDQKLLSTKPKNKLTGHGLTNMKERAELIGATFNINTLENLGVIVSTQLPLTEDCYE